MILDVGNKILSRNKEVFQFHGCALVDHNMDDRIILLEGAENEKALFSILHMILDAGNKNVVRKKRSISISWMYF